MNAWLVYVIIAIAAMLAVGFAAWRVDRRIKRTERDSQANLLVTRAATRLAHGRSRDYVLASIEIEARAMGLDPRCIVHAAEQRVAKLASANGGTCGAKHTAGLCCARKPHNGGAHLEKLRILGRIAELEWWDADGHLYDADSFEPTWYAPGGPDEYGETWTPGQFAGYERIQVNYPEIAKSHASAIGA